VREREREREKRFEMKRIDRLQNTSTTSQLIPHFRLWLFFQRTSTVEPLDDTTQREREERK
jgi:hypothetical protein